MCDVIRVFSTEQTALNRPRPGTTEGLNGLSTGDPQLCAQGVDRERRRATPLGPKDVARRRQDHGTSAGRWRGWRAATWRAPEPAWVAAEAALARPQVARSGRMRGRARAAASHRMAASDPVESRVRDRSRRLWQNARAAWRSPRRRPRRPGLDF